MPNHISCVSFLKKVAVLHHMATRIVNNVDALRRLLIRIRNKIGPNIVPCGTSRPDRLTEYLKSKKGHNSG